MDQVVKRITTNFMKKDSHKGISILVLIIIVFFFDVLFLNKTLSSIQVPGVLGTGPYGHSGKYTHRALIDPGGSTWGPAPHMRLVSEQYKHGIFPLWNPFQGIGQPLAGNMDSNAFNPLRFLLFWNPTPFFGDLFLLFRLLLAGIFAYLFMKSIQVDHLSSLFTAILFMFCGYFIFGIDMHHLDVEIFLPFLFLCLERMIQRRGDLNWIILGAVGIFFTIVGGQPQSAFLILSFSACYYVFRLLAFPGNRGVKLFGRYISLYIFTALLGLALAAVILFPFYEFWELSWNNHDPRTGHLLGISFNPYFRDFISFYVPYFLGPIHGSWLKEYSWHILTRGYWGVAAVTFALLALGGAFRSRVEKNYYIYFFAGALALMVAKLYGYSPVNWIGRLPVANMVNFGKYLGPLMAFACAVLAGLGLERMAEGEDRFPRVKTAGKILILAMICTFFYFYQYMSDHSEVLARIAKFSTFFQYSVRNIVLAQMTVALFFIALVTVTYFLYARKKILGAARFKKAILVIALIELFVYIPNPGILKKRNERFDIFNRAPYLEYLQAHLGNHRIVAVDRILYPDFGSAFAMRDIRALDALLPKRYMEMAGDFFNLPSPPDRFTGDEGIDFKKPEVARILNLLGVKYVLSSADLLPSNMTEEILKRGKITLAPGQPYRHWINTSSLTIDGSTKGVLFAHAPAQIEYKAYIPPGCRLDFSIGLVPGAWSPEKGDGVLFEIHLRDGQRQGTIFSKYIDPKRKSEDRRWVDCSVDLSSSGGREISLTFVTLPGIDNSVDNSFDWSVWGDIQLTDPGRRENLKLVYNKEIRIYENLDVFPRAFVAHQYLVMQGKEQILKALKEGNLDLRHQVVLEERIPEELARKLSPNFQTQAEDVIIEKNRVDLMECSTKMENPGFLVFSDLYYPGWNAYVDGQKAKIYQTDYTLRSVFLEGGNHTVKFVYEPMSFKIGAWISGSTLLLILMILIGKIFLKQRKRKLANSGKADES